MPRCLTPEELAIYYGPRDALGQPMPITPEQANSYEQTWSNCLKKAAQRDHDETLDAMKASSRSSVLLTAGYGGLVFVAGGVWLYNRKRKAGKAYTPIQWRWWMAYVMAALLLLYKLPLLAHELGTAEATVRYGILVLLFGSVFCGTELLIRSLPQWRRRLPDALFAAVAQELESGNLDRGLWTRLYAANNGDERKTRAAYIRERARALHRSPN